MDDIGGQPSRIHGRIITGSARRKRQATTSAAQLQADYDVDDARLPTPEPDPSRASMDTHGSYMGAASTSRSADDIGQQGAHGDDGGPLIHDLIPDYDHHVGRAVWDGEERGLLTVHSRSHALSVCEITDDGVLRLLRESGLGHLPDIMYEHIDEPLLCAFVERWVPSTSSFHMPFGEMSVTLHDTAFILGVPIRGQTITPACDGTPEDVLRVLALALGSTLSEDALRAHTGFHNSSIRHASMRDLVRSGRYTSTVVARVYLWYFLTCTLFIDRTKTHAAASFLELLMTPAAAGTYAWGAAALAFLYRDLGVCSRRGCRQMACCTTLLQAWIYSYFPCFRPMPWSYWTADMPHATRWRPRPKFARPEQALESLREYRIMIDNLTANDIDWLPFGHDPARRHPISAFRGIIHCRSVTEAYMPDRIARQFGYEQSIPRPVLAPRRAHRPTNNSKYDVQHDPAVWVFLEGEESSTFRRHARAAVASDCTEGYMDWYIPRTHPRLVRAPPPPLPAYYRYDHYQSMQQMAGTLAVYHRNEYHEEVGVESEDLRNLADICDRMMPAFYIDREGDQH